MHNLSIRARIVLGIAVLVLVILGIGGLSLTNLRTIHEESDRLRSNSLPGLWAIGQVSALSAAEFVALQNAVLTAKTPESSRQQSEFKQLQAEVSESMQRYEGTIQLAEDRQIFSELEAAHQKFINNAEAALKSSEASGRGTNSIELLRIADKSFQDYLQSLKRVSEFNRTISRDSADEISGTVGAAQRAILLSLIICVCLAVACGMLLARMTKDLSTIIHQVQRATMQVNTSVTEIVSTAREQQATASEIAATTIEVGATSKEISATSRELVKSMNEVSSVAERTAELAASGQSGLGRMESTIHQIMDASGSISDRLAILNEKAGSINTVVTTIAKVADQTNLLSLNAAIEAEKAGEYGRGFAVVAGEIRRLADQTAVATLDIEQMVKEMQSAVSAGVMGLDKFTEAVRRGVEVVGNVGEQLTQIIEQVRTLTPNFETVNEGMQSQSLGAEQISEALSQLSEAANQTVESLRQSNKVIEQLNDTVHGLQGSVSRFTLVG